MPNVPIVPVAPLPGKPAARPRRQLQVALIAVEDGAGRLLTEALDRLLNEEPDDGSKWLGCLCTTYDTIERFEQAPASPAPDLILLSGEGTDRLEFVRRHGDAVRIALVAKPDPVFFFALAKAGADAVFALPLELGPCLSGLRAMVEKPQKAGLSEQGSIQGSAQSAVAMPEAGGKGLHTTIPSLFATSPGMAGVRATIEQAAPTSATVLIQGESGVGKELAARLIHSRSRRAERAFIKVNCAAIPSELLESELFGYEAGAFTGAVRAKPGKFELADGGTIFLDEIGEMHPMLQAKLLHVLQDGDFARLGSKRDISVDVRVICASNQPLDRLVAQGLFREDLYYRIQVITIALPPLRQRKLEIPALIEYFVQHYAKVYGKPVPTFDPEAITVLMHYDWPGNIRELENVCKRHVIMGGGAHGILEREARRPRLEGAGTETGGPASMEMDGEAVTAQNDDFSGKPSLLEIGKSAAGAAERKAILAMLEKTRWNRREAARCLQVSYKALLNKIKTYELD